MPIAALLADISLSDSELTFIKFAAYCLTLLWGGYLVKEIFVGHKPDPMLSMLAASNAKLAESVATLNAQSVHRGDQMTDLRNMQIRDTDAIFKKIDALDEKFQAVLREHDREIGRLESGGNHQQRGGAHK